MLTNYSYLDKSIFIVTQMVRCRFGIIGPYRFQSRRAELQPSSFLRYEGPRAPSVGTPACPQPPQAAQEQALDADSGL